MRRRVAWTLGAACVGLSAAGVIPVRVDGAARLRAQTPEAGPRAPFMPYGDVQPIVAEIREDLRPVGLRGRSEAAIERAWPEWVVDHDREIRSRIAEGDDDSVVNLLLYGVGFTRAPRLTELDIASMSGGQSPPETLHTRIADMARAIVAPAGDAERLQFARDVLARRDIDVRAPGAEPRVEQWLELGVSRAVVDYRHRVEVAVAASVAPARDPAITAIEQATVFRDRGLSSDTTLLAGYGLDEALRGLKSAGLDSGVHRVAVVGPGLDFTDKREGFDFYPPQTIQPFAVLDSLSRTGLARLGDVRLTTFELSSRINQHIANAVQKAFAGDPYVLQLPRETEPFHWHPSLVRYWRAFGDQIGREVSPIRPPAGIANLEIRAVSVRPDVVKAVAPVDLNIVLQRLELAPADRFDLIVATNILLYYDSFEQSLAAENIAHMLRAGGVLLTNTSIPLLPSLPMALVRQTTVAYTDRGDGDRLLAYQRN